MELLQTHLYNVSSNPYLQQNQKLLRHIHILLIFVLRLQINDHQRRRISFLALFVDYFLDLQQPNL